MTHAVNAATIKGAGERRSEFQRALCACPWFPEIADYAKAHPEVDFGLHLTLTSERVLLPVGPVAPRDRVTSLVDENGIIFGTTGRRRCASTTRCGSGVAGADRAGVRDGNPANAFGFAPSGPFSLIANASGPQTRTPAAILIAPVKVAPFLARRRGHRHV